MSRWVERILREFPPDLSRFWIAVDPDDILLDEHVLVSLRDSGFVVLPFDDPIAFRTEYEERFRAAWDRDQSGPSKALVLHLKNSVSDELPWDYLREGRRVSLSLAELFPRLSYGVVRQVGSEHRETLFQSSSYYGSQTLGDAATKDFILTHVFGISPYLISRTETLWRELLRLHINDRLLPPVLASHVASVLDSSGAFRKLPIEKLFSSKSHLVSTVQDEWKSYVDRNVVEGEGRVDAAPDNSDLEPGIPFEHPDIRVLVDSMFLDGTLRPVVAGGRAINLPDWVKVGIVEDPGAMPKLVSEGASRLAEILPGADASHREWFQFSRRMGEVISRFHSLGPAQVPAVAGTMIDLQNAADECFRKWVTAYYANLPSLPAANAPVMMHHVPRFLSYRRDAGEARVALLVFDGLAMDQWVQIRDSLAQRRPDLAFEDNACFAWAPTITSVSRQALFSGLKPREFSNSIEATAQEPTLWSRFWQDHGLRPNEILYRKGIKRTEQLLELQTEVSNRTIKVVGLVVDTVDEFVHGAIFGKRGIAGQIGSWCESGFVEALFDLLLDNGFHTYLTADHGNVDAVGIGRLTQGVAVELRGARVRTYRNETLAASTPGDMDTFRLEIPGLPVDFLPVFAGGRGAFVQKDEPVVAHGGLSVEELIVPFVKASRVSKD